MLPLLPPSGRCAGEQHGGTPESPWQRRTLPHTAASAGPNVPIRRLLPTPLHPPPVWWALPGGDRCRSGHAVVEASTARRRLCTTPWKIPASCRVARAEVVLMCGQVAATVFSGAPCAELWWGERLLSSTPRPETWCCRHCGVTGSGVSSPPATFFFFFFPFVFCRRVLFWQGKKKLGWAILSCVRMCVMLACVF